MMGMISSESWTDTIVPPAVSPKRHDRDAAEPVTYETADEARGARGEGRNAAVERFAFPEISPFDDEPAAGRSPKAIWPKCDCTETKEACVELAKTLHARLPSDRAWVLAITSPSDGDGKTSLITALAPELAKTFAGVLAVDADFQQADLTARLSLVSDDSGDDAPLIYPTDFAGLSVAPMRIEQQERQSFEAAWLDTLRKDWPLTILDMASLRHPATASILGLCDGVCLVVRLGHTAHRAVARAITAIECCGAKFLGCVAVGEAEKEGLGVGN